MAAQHDHRFGSGEPFSLGVEEELFLVDPVTGRQTNSSADVVQRLGDTLGTVEREMHACQIELITNVHSGVGEAVRELAELRRAVVQTGAALLGSGTHPSADEGDAVIIDKEGYERIQFLLGDAVVTPVGGLHVHIGMPDSETAIKVFKRPAVRSAASAGPGGELADPAWSQHRFASARELSLRGWPRSGAPRGLRDFADFCEMSRRLTHAADVPDYTWFWWKLRPHPRLGTVEIRALDAQASLTDAGALIALVHCLARDAAEREPMDDPPPELVDEGMFRAARFGVHDGLPDAEGTRREHGGPSPNSWKTRWAGQPPGATSWDVSRSSRSYLSSCAAEAEPACSAPPTRSRELTPSSETCCNAPAVRRFPTHSQSYVPATPDFRVFPPARLGRNRLGLTRERRRRAPRTPRASGHDTMQRCVERGSPAYRRATA